ncbi:MAG: hypothetical protein L6M37_05990 [Candidatus Methylarchaceae archaeon HK02M1]|nr:hypothetical protein [Candidatus Methylarchaceae archaeon HK02M1]
MDFSQELITTLHTISVDGDELEKSLMENTVERPVSLVLPMLYEEIKKPALSNIIDNLNKAKYIKEVVVALCAKDKEEYQDVVNYFSRLNLSKIIVWCNGYKVQEVLTSLKERGMDVTSFAGKGMDVWIALGIASLDSYAIILHDADIVNYELKIPMKLLFPIVEPNLDFFFNKGYYARIDTINDRVMYGRVFRLFLRPLIESFAEVVSIHRYQLGLIRYFRSFKYALSGEMAMTSNLALNIRIPCDWGLEIGLLAEVHRNVAIKRVCQVDLGIYQHKHHGMNLLDRMCEDILCTLLRVSTEEHGLKISRTMLMSLQVAYRRIAQDAIRQYYADAIFNSLKYDRNLEELMVDKFAEVIRTAGGKYLYEPYRRQIPDWLRALSAMPKLREKLKNATLLDLEEVKLTP